MLVHIPVKFEEKMWEFWFWLVCMLAIANPPPNAAEHLSKLEDQEVRCTCQTAAAQETFTPATCVISQQATFGKYNIKYRLS